MQTQVQKKEISVNPSFLLKIESLRIRAKKLTDLRKSLALKPNQDIRTEQWEVLETQLATVSNKIQHSLRMNADKYLSERFDIKLRRALINRLGELELEITTAYNFYDTFMDILTQRLSDEIGPLLRGCDVIAEDALKRGFLADITVPPLVYCERGFGASTLREGVNILPHVPNPIMFISIPYSRINEKYNLISINHEVGHQALVKLNMLQLLETVFREALQKAGASSMVCDLYANWSREIGPDFWAFGLSGMAQTCSLRDILVLPIPMMFNFSLGMTHPPSFLRFLISAESCRQIWGKGDWDDWEAEWRELYSSQSLDEASRLVINEAQRFIPVVVKALIGTRFKKLNRKPLLSLFAMDKLEPKKLKMMANTEGVKSIEFKKNPIGVQLAVFRLMRENRNIKLAEIDQLMGLWLKNLSIS